MIDADVCRWLVAAREHLHGQGILADDLTDDQVVDKLLPALRICAGLLRLCTMLPGSWDKRFVKYLLLTNDETLTVRQAAVLAKLRFRYRRQIKLPVPSWASVWEEIEKRRNA